MITLPAWQLVNIVTLTQCVIFSIFVLAVGARQTYPAILLSAIFVIFAAIKADQFYQMLGGLEHYPEYGFVLTPVQALMTPALYLFIVFRANPDAEWRWRTLIHAAPMIVLAVYLAGTYYRFPLEQKELLIASGALATPVNRLAVPLIGDTVQLLYIAAAYRRLQHFGLSLRDWFSDTKGRDLFWMKALLAAWAAVFLLHALVTILIGAFGLRQQAFLVLSFLDLVHLAMANILGLMAMRDISRVEGDGRLAQAITADRHYAGDSLSPAAQATLFERAATLLSGKKLFLDPDLTLGGLAEHLGATPRDLSQAINGAGKQSYFEFINRARVEEAKIQLKQNAGKRVIDIAFECGFNSKSAFHNAFGKYAGCTPSDWRKNQDQS